MARTELRHAPSGSPSPRGHRAGRPLLHPLEASRVDREQLVHRAGVLRAELVAGVVAIAAGLERAVVGDVARGLLEVGGEAAALEDLGQQVRGVLAGQVRPADLRDRVVAVADEDPLVEAGRALAFGPVEGPPTLGYVGGELIEEEAAQRARVPRIPREQGALDRLRQVHEAEHGPVEVGEVAGEDLALGGGEFLDRVAHRTDPRDARRRRDGPA